MRCRNTDARAALGTRRSASVAMVSRRTGGAFASACIVVAPRAAGEPPQQAHLAIEDLAHVSTFDLPAPRIREVECAADLAGAPVRHVEKSPRIAAIPASTLGEVEHDTTRC